MVERLIVEGVCKGVVTQAGAEYAKTVVITTGTFYAARLSWAT